MTRHHRKCRTSRNGALAIFVDRSEQVPRLIPPEIFEPIGRQFRIPHCVLNILVPHPGPGSPASPKTGLRFGIVGVLAAWSALIEAGPLRGLVGDTHRLERRVNNEARMCQMVDISWKR